MTLSACRYFSGREQALLISDTDASGPKFPLMGRGTISWNQPCVAERHTDGIAMKE
jgi:hypothetical protein